jgi:hypothetical protein
MQTPIQKLISIIDEQEKNCFFEIATETMRIHFQSLLPYEKQCIYKSYDAGVEAMDKRGVEIRALCDVDEWFEETFDNKGEPLDYSLEKKKIIDAFVFAYLIGENDITIEDATTAAEKYYNEKYTKQ